MKNTITSVTLYLLRQWNDHRTIYIFFLPGDKEFGGIPPVIFKLKALRKLDLSYTAITMFPNHAKSLLKLNYLNLEHCPLLESIGGEVGLLPDLKSNN